MELSRNILHTLPKLEKWFIAFGFLIVLVAGTYHLSESPGIWFDEGMFTQTAVNLEKHGTQTIQVAPNQFQSASTITGGFPFIAPIALSYKLFGVGVLQGRAIMVVFILAFSIAAYIVTLNLFGRTSALWTLFLLSSFAMLYGNGKSVLGEVPGLFYLLLSCIALIHLEKSAYQSLLAYATTGFFVGLCVVTKPVFILILPALFLAWLLRFRTSTLTLKGITFGILAFLLPIGIWIHLQFGGEPFSSILSFYANPYSVPNLLFLINQNIQRFFIDTTALYTLVLLAIWAISFLRKRKTSIAEMMAFLFSLLIIAASLRLPGWNRYIFPATIVALLFLPSSLMYLIKHHWIAYTFLLFLFCGQMYQVMFSSYVAQYYYSHRTEEISAVLQTLSTSSVFVYNVPEIVVMLPSANYYQFIKPYTNNDVGAYGTDSMIETRYIIIGKTDPAISTFTHYRLVKTFNRYSILERV